MSIGSKIRNKARLAGDPEDTGPRDFFMVFIFSLLCHAFFFIGVFFLYNVEFSAPKLQVITVDLVTFEPGPAGKTQAFEKSSGSDQPASDSDQSALDDDNKVNLDAASQTSSEPDEPKEQEIPVLKPDVSLKSKPDDLQDLIAAREKEPPKEKPVEKEPPKEKPVEKEPPKEKPVEKKKKDEENAKKKAEQDLKAKKKAEQDLAKAKKEQAEKLERQNQNQLKNALKRMEASVASKERGAQGSNSRRNSGAGSAGGDGSAGGYGSVGEAGALTLYQMVIKSAIEQNWVFNDAMAGLNQNLEVRIFIKILKDGEIRDISFETRSGNNYLDESARKAVQRANPLPELPKGMSSYELVLGFSPKGLN